MSTTRTRQPRASALGHVSGLLGVWVATLLLAGCGPRVPKSDDDLLALAAGAAVGAEASKTQHFVLWAEKGEERSTLWIRGNALASEIVGIRPGLLLPGGDALWEWREEPAELPLCDCEAWQEAASEGPCPAAAETADATRILLHDLVSGAEIELLSAPTVDPAAGPELVYYHGAASPVATVGPYVFVRHGEESLACGAAHNSWSGGFTVWDLDQRAEVEVLDAADRERIATAERETAYKLFDGDKLVDIGSPDDLELTVIEPSYQPGRGLVLTYQFTADASFADSDENWGSYSRSVDVEARALPTALVPFAPIPPALQNLAIVGDDLRVGGWAVFGGTAETMEALLVAFGVAAEPAVD